MQLFILFYKYILTQCAGHNNVLLKNGLRLLHSSKNWWNNNNNKQAVTVINKIYVDVTSVFNKIKSTCAF